MLDTSLKDSQSHFEEILQKLLQETQKELAVVTARVDELNVMLQDKDMQTDRSENASFQIAKDERDVKTTVQSLLQKRIAALQEASDSATYVPTGMVQLGTIVELTLLSLGGKPPIDPRTHFVVKMVNREIAKASLGLVAIDSKAGSALMFKRAGAVFDVSALKGIAQYRIERIY